MLINQNEELRKMSLMIYDFSHFVELFGFTLEKKSLMSVHYRFQFSLNLPTHTLKDVSHTPFSASMVHWLSFVQAKKK